MSYGKEHYELARLILALIDGTITKEEFMVLDKQLAENPDFLSFYANFITLQSQLLHSREFFVDVPGESILDNDLWHMLLEDQQNAEAIEEQNPREEIPCAVQKISYTKPSRQISKLSVYTAVTSAAALLLLFLFAQFMPPKGGYEVAILADSLGATWADTMSLQKGSRISANDAPLLLRQGYAELQFDNQTKVTIEGPAEFTVSDEDQIKLAYGRLYAMVPREAIGFTVKTPSAQIVDLGTEFGVDIDLQGDTALHVMKGKTVLIGGNKFNKMSVEVGQGAAKKITTDDHAISDISCEDQLFVREIDSAHHFVWRGETAINLADIVGGGNGFNSGQINAGIDVATGKPVPDLLDDGVKVGPAGYKAVESTPFIDGVFVPGLEDGRVPITADHSVAVAFSRTSGNYWGTIFNGAFHQGGNVGRHTLQLNGMLFGTPENPSIAIHSNQGITFDLFKIRQSLPDMDIKKFRSLIGISETVEAYGEHSTAEFRIFLDGRKVYEKKMSNSDNAADVEIPVAANDHYLTLVVTEADDIWSFDWALFGWPELVIELTK